MAARLHLDFETKSAADIKATGAPRELTCPVCGLSASALPPKWRFVNGDGNLLCRHPFGIPATNVPDWETQDFYGHPLQELSD
jgi:hypothetical protein